MHKEQPQKTSVLSKRKKKNIIFISSWLLILFVIIIFVPKTLFQKLQTTSIYNTIKQVLIIQNNKQEIKSKTKELYEQNNDFVGMLTIPGTTINYPVMYTKSDYYLRRNFNKMPSVAGTLYIDKYNSLYPKDDNLIIYGHNMDDGTMFHDLLKYKDYNFYQEHPKFYFNNQENQDTYEVIAAFVSKVYKKTDDVFKYYKFYNANTKQELDDYVQNIKQLSIYETNVEAPFNSEFITLSTCDYTMENGRFVVIGKKII